MRFHTMVSSFFLNRKYQTFRFGHFSHPFLSRSLGVQAGALLALNELPVEGGVEEARVGVSVHEGVDLQLGLLVHVPAGLRQAVVNALSHTRVQADLQRQPVRGTPHTSCPKS